LFSPLESSKTIDFLMNMPKENKVLVKISGDLVSCPEVLSDIENLASNSSNHLNIVYGFGTKLSEELARNLH